MVRPPILAETPPRTAVRRLAAARFVSLAGSGAAFSALAYIVFHVTGGSSTWVSITLLVTFGAQGVFAPLGGALGDRFDRRKVLIAADLAAAAGFVALAFARTPGQMVVLAFVTAALEAPIWSVSNAAVPNFVEPEDLSWANGTIAVGRNIGFLIGPIIGGGLVALLAADDTVAKLHVAGYWVFGLNAATFVASAALVRSIRRPFADRDRHGADEHRGLTAGFRFLVGDRVLRTITLAWMVLLLGAGFTLVAEIPLAEWFGSGSFGYGLLSAFWGGGAALGSVLGQRLLTARREPVGLLIGTASVGLGLGLIAVAPWFAIALVLTAIGGTGEGYSGVAEQGILQRRTPDAVRSRVMGASEAAILVAFAASFAFGGPVVDAIGFRGAYAIAGISCGAGALVLLTVLGEMRRDARSRAPAVAPSGEPAPAIEPVLGDPIPPPAV